MLKEEYEQLNEEEKYWVSVAPYFLHMANVIIVLVKKKDE
jgi:hypothetical protein